MAKREMASLRITFSAVPVTAGNHEMRLLSDFPYPARWTIQLSWLSYDDLMQVLITCKNSGSCAADPDIKSNPPQLCDTGNRPYRFPVTCSMRTHR